jgi:tetratricopeptide (TPR) repeat protein
MIAGLLLAVVLTMGASFPALAAGSRSTSRPPAPAQSEPSKYEMGVKALKGGNYARAAALFEQAVEADPGNADGWNYLGFSYRNLKQFDKALPAYRKALAINSNHLGANEYLGELYVQTDRIDQAQDVLQKLRALCPAGCKEYDDLKKSIMLHESSRKR